MLLAYIRENNPDLLRQLEEDDALHAWVLDKLKEVEMVLSQSKPGSQTEQRCMDIMTADIKPSKFRYVRDLFEERFPDEYDRMLEAGTLTYEVLAMAGLCHNLFEDHPIVDDMEDPQLDRLAVAAISNYLHEQMVEV